METSGGCETVPISKDSSKCFALYNAAISGDWETANTLFFEKNPEESEAIISFDRETTLHVAVQSGKANDFVDKLVDMMSAEALALRDNFDETALHKAAKVGNKKAAIAMLAKNPDLLYMLCSEGRLAVTIAAQYGQRETLVYLISVSEPNVKNNPFEGQLGIALLIQIIGCHFFDVALDLVKEYPDLARLGLDNSHRCALSFTAEMDTVFPTREFSNYGEILIYRFVHLNQDAKRSTSVPAGDIEDPMHKIKRRSTWLQIINGGKCLDYFAQLLYVLRKRFKATMIWKYMEYKALPVKRMRDEKEKWNQAVELAKYLCNEMKLLPEKDAWIMLQDSIFRAAEHNICVILKLIMEMFPIVTASVDSTGRTIMHVAASNRSTKVFNLIYNMSDRKHLFSGVDNEGNNLMHMCARLAPPHRLNLVFGAALQMQRELQWFNEVQKFVPPSSRNWVNKDGKTPKMLFIEEHRELKAQGEKWMKDTANACSIAATLIATVVFAAVFTVPGGVSSETGIPLFFKEGAFTNFMTGNAVALFSSITSLLMFLSILTSRYAEEDFLHVLPKRLSYGVFGLCLSITFMLFAFCSALSLAFRKDRGEFVRLVAVFSWWPIATFLLLQLPLHSMITVLDYSSTTFSKVTDTQLY